MILLYKHNPNEFKIYGEKIVKKCVHVNKKTNIGFLTYGFLTKYWFPYQIVENANELETVKDNLRKKLVIF